MQYFLHFQAVLVRKDQFYPVYSFSSILTLLCNIMVSWHQYLWGFLRHINRVLRNENIKKSFQLTDKSLIHPVERSCILQVWPSGCFSFALSKYWLTQRPNLNSFISKMAASTYFFRSCAIQL